jgi:hypothetical protein
LTCFFADAFPGLFEADRLGRTMTILVVRTLGMIKDGHDPRDVLVYRHLRNTKHLRRHRLGPLQTRRDPARAFLGRPTPTVRQGATQVGEGGHMLLRDILNEDVAAAGMVEQANGGSNLLDRDRIPCALAFVDCDAGFGGIDEVLLRLDRHRLDRSRLDRAGRSRLGLPRCRDRRLLPRKWCVVRQCVVDPAGWHSCVRQQVRRRLAARHRFGGADRDAQLVEVRGRRRDREVGDIAVDLLCGDRATTLEIEDRIGDSLRLALVPAVVDQSLIVIKRPFRLDAELRQEGPCLRIARVEAGVIDGGGAAAKLILKDALQLPAQRVAENLLELVGTYPRGSFAIPHAQCFRRRTEAQGDHPRVRKAHRTHG